MNGTHDTAPRDRHGSDGVGHVSPSPPPKRGASERTRNDERAVSDLVGYVLTVGILLMGVGIVSTVGVDVIEEAQGNQNAESVERGMRLLETNFDQVVESRAEVRTTSLALSTGRISFGAGQAPSNVTVNVSGVGYGPRNYNLTTIQYLYDDATVAYEGGGVFRNETRGNAILRADPTFQCTDEDGVGGPDYAVVTVVTLQGPAVGSSFGGATADVIARENASRVLFPVNRVDANSTDNSTGVTVTINSTYQDAWESYLTGGDQEWNTTASDNEYSCGDPSSGSVMPVYVRQVILDVSVRR